VCNIDLVGFERSDLEKLSAAMQVPFPELTVLGAIYSTAVGESSEVAVAVTVLVAVIE
jgi:hypothetical protein